MKSLRLGRYDRDVQPPEPGSFLEKYHENMPAYLKVRKQFRDERYGRWASFEDLGHQEIRKVQRWLKEFGFMPNAIVDGIYGYGTMAAVRLFQEYVRSIELLPDIGIPDGIVGNKTRQHLQRWADHQETVRWANIHSATASMAFNEWIRCLKKWRDHRLIHREEPLIRMNEQSALSATLTLAEYTTDLDRIHLIGIRSGENRPQWDRPNDDPFVLLIRGMAWYGWGSCDPNPRLASRSDEAYLIPGQHRYSFGWHKKNKRDRVYKAMVPNVPGVRVVRDVNDDNALTTLDFPPYLESPNITINIHWSGDGRLNYSAGCQVISGASYLNEFGDCIDCRDFAATTYRELGSTKTKAAYNVFSDLISCYGKVDRPSLMYTLMTRRELETIDAPLAGKVYNHILPRLQRHDP